MDNIVNYGLREAYQSLKVKDKLAMIDPLIEWESLRSIVKGLYRNNTEKGGRPNVDEVVMLKTLFLQSMYGYTDEAMERELHDRISFRNFLHYPEIMPDSRTIWLFRERLSNTGMDKTIWEAIWKQLESKGIKIKAGTVQDASFIETDPGKHGKKKPPAPIDPSLPETSNEKDVNALDSKKIAKEEKKAAKIRAAEKKRLRREERRSAKTRRSKDGTYAKKGDKTHFGNKLHTAVGVDMPLIRELVVTTASLHDSQVDLSIPGIPCYRDKGYAGGKCRGINATMDKASRNHPLTVEKVRRNKRITRKRSPGERPYAVMKGIMNGGHTFVTMIRRYRVKAMFLCLGYNTLTLITLKKQGKIA
ncbi:MAG: IS5 family transposase [Thermoplasmataceae archaeon]